MKRLLLINPNVSPGMTAAVRMAAMSRLPREYDLVAVTATFGFPVIATRLSYAVAACAALEAYAGAGEGWDAALVACFGDPGLEALRELTTTPVVGFAEASLRAAQRRGQPYAIVTIGTPWVSMLEERVVAARATGGFVGVFALEGTGLDALKAPETVLPGLAALARQAIAAGGRTIILGGAALAGLAERLPPEADYIDCVAAAMAEACAAPGPSERRLVAQPGPAVGLSSRLREKLAPPIA